MTDGIGLGVAILMPLSGVGEPGVSFFGQATILGHPFVLNGGNSTGAWQIVAQLEGTIDLRHTLESLLGPSNGSFRLPRGFPELTLSELSFSFDAGSGDYNAHGRTVAASLPIAGSLVKDASLTLDLGSTKGAFRAALQSRVVWQGVDAQLDVQIGSSSSAIRFSANRYEFFLGRAVDDQGSNLLALIRPGTGLGFHDVELAWAKTSWSEVPFRPNVNYSAGVTLQAVLVLAGTKVGRLLQIDEPIRLRLNTGELDAEIGTGTTSRKITIALNHANAAAVAPSTTDPSIESFATSDEDDDVDEATNAQLTITGPLSLATLIEKLSPSSDGSSTSSTWRDYVGKCLQLENVGLSLVTDPKIGVSMVFDATIQVGSWLGIAVRKASFKLIPDKLPFTDVDVDANLQSAAIVLNLPPIARASAAVLYERTDATSTDVITGSGQLHLFDKLSVGLLVNFEWQKREFRGAFGFVFAKGFAVGPPAFQLTGIGGGFGYHRTFVLPTAAEAVAKNAMVNLLQNDPDGDVFEDPSRMLKHLRTFMQSLETQPHAWCIAFGITFKIVEWVDCMALVLAQMRPPEFDLALLGMANFPIGVSSFKLGHVQLGLFTRWNSQDHSLRILGTLTNKSWLLHSNCKLRGGFAICLWFAGSYAGDFVVSMGGYSPLVPAKPHYPKLDRLGFTWNVTKALKLYGELYFTLDRYGIQFGGRAGLKFTSRILDVDANFSFDVLATWMPPFFQTKVRVSVQFELRAIATLRLGLVVDASVHGPPFGAEFFLEIDIKVWRRVFTIRAGASLEAAKKSAKPNPRDVLAFAKNGQATATQLHATGQSLAKKRDASRTEIVSFAQDHAEPLQRFRADDLVLTLATTIPIKTVYRQRESTDTRHPYIGDRIDVRPLGWQDVISDLIWDIRGPTDTAEWICIPEMSRPLEALWYLPASNESSWKDSGRLAITSLRLGAPTGQRGDVGLGNVPHFGGVSIGMYDHFLPGAKAGSYTLRIESRMKPSAKAEAFHHEIKELEFVVDAPRFAFVSQEEVRSCSPPHGGNADYRRMLPHLVLDKRALPWERSLVPQSSAAGDRAIPWMTLLVLTNDEIVADGARLHEMRVEDLRRGDATSIGPALDIMPEESEQSVQVLELSAKLFRAICPRIEELCLLAHVRRVAIDDKHDGHAEAERDFAILTANRLVQPGANVVLLVSLEGWHSWIKDEPADPFASRVRVVVLHSWNFVCDEGDGSFAAQIKKLDVALSADRAAVAATNDPALQSMLTQGYTPIAYERDGAVETSAWYRGPLSPVLDARFESDRIPFDSPDSALVMEETTGKLDVSLSSAFQLGRLLALSSPSFGAALRHWNFMKQLDVLETNPSASERISLVEEMAQYAASHVLGAETADTLFEDVKVVSEWLVRLRLLQPIPFRYLVPTASLLPPESLRFFYVDENWVDALTDGALSLGASSSSTHWFLQSNRGALRKTLHSMMLAYRKQRAKGTPSASAADDQTPMCGFLLRSSLLDRFPGVEVECFTADTTPRKLDILRMELLGRGLLLVLVSGKPEHVEFQLPREALTLSHDEMGLRPRMTHSTDQDLGARNPNATPIVIDEYYREDRFVRGVLDVRKLHDRLEGPSDTSGARFALHWLNGPDDVVIRWEHADLGGLS